MKKLLLTISLMFSVLVSAFDEFVISDIRVVGLQRVSIGSIFTIIPISVGDRMSEEKVRDIVLALIDTDQFNDMKISQDGTALIFNIKESFGCKFSCPL